MAYENNEKQQESVYSKRLRAGKRRTYFFDVRATKGNDYFLTITESRKRFNEDGYDRHKIFLYKEDFNKFAAALVETIDYVKTDLMPDFDFDAFAHEYEEEGAPVFESAQVLHTTAQVTENEAPASELNLGSPLPSDDTNENLSTEHVDSW